MSNVNEAIFGYSKSKVCLKALAIFGLVRKNRKPFTYFNKTKIIFPAKEMSVNLQGKTFI